ISARGS
ncbi:unnamed protein product, partial [Diplocarpon coronariae]